MKDFVRLPEVVYDVRARDGTWCKFPYPDHSKGCPNFPKCRNKNPDFQQIQQKYEWYAVLQEFDLATHAENMKKKHPTWTKRQCRNLLYWQNSLRKRLREKALSYKKEYDILLEIPEASGINVFDTLSQVGIILQRTQPNYIIKTMFIGKPRWRTTLAINYADGDSLAEVLEASQ